MVEIATNTTTGATSELIDICISPTLPTTTTLGTVTLSHQAVPYLLVHQWMQFHTTNTGNTRVEVLLQTL